MFSLEKNVKTILSKPNVKEARLYEKLCDDKIKCILCERRCIVGDGERGFCKTRININGKLYTLIYGDLSAVESRPIEIKPFFHYWVGSTALTFSTWSCNFTCPWCQNHHLSKVDPNPLNSSYYSPEEIINLALKLGDEGLCASFQEPTLLTEWCLDAFKLGSIKGLYCCYVSNGYMTIEALRLLRLSGMDGLKVDVKGGKEEYKKYCGGVDVDVIWRNAAEAKKMGIHVEVVNLIVTGVNDNEECIRETIETHVKKLGVEVPIHFTRYYPAYKFNNPPTKIEILEKAYKTAKNLGVYYPYLGNVPGHPWENTYCPSCGELLVGRIGYKIVKYNINLENKCQRCGFRINLTGKFIKKLYKLPF